MTLSEAFEMNGLSDILTDDNKNKFIKLFGLLNEFNSGVNVTTVQQLTFLFLNILICLHL